MLKVCTLNMDVVFPPVATEPREEIHYPLIGGVTVERLHALLTNPVIKGEEYENACIVYTSVKMAMRDKASQVGVRALIKSLLVSCGARSGRPSNEGELMAETGQTEWEEISMLTLNEPSVDEQHLDRISSEVLRHGSFNKHVWLASLGWQVLKISTPTLGTSLASGVVLGGKLVGAADFPLGFSSAAASTSTSTLRPRATSGVASGRDRGLFGAFQSFLTSTAMHLQKESKKQEGVSELFERALELREEGLFESLERTTGIVQIDELPVSSDQDLMDMFNLQ